MSRSSYLRRTLQHDSMLDILRLSRSENVGPVTFLKLLQQFGSAAAALEAIPDLAHYGGRKKPLRPCPPMQAQQELSEVIKAGARMIHIGEEDYPTLLAEINDPPPVITLLGHPHLWRAKRSIAIVGARNASALACQFTRKLAQEAGNKGLLVVSGLARGIDTAAHTGSLATGTIAVMGSGIGQIYPPENTTLHDAIAQQGCVITEQPFNAQPHARAFPGRNRIIAGMTLGTVVVEAALKSGSLITARFAAEQGRDVFAVPGSPLDPRCKGTNHLLKQGAFLCESVEDILENLSSQPRLQLGETENKNFEHRPPTPPDNGERNEARQRVMNRLGFSPVSTDELLHQCEITPNMLALVLLELELAGRLQRHAGSKVALCYPSDDIDKTA